MTIALFARTAVADVKAFEVELRAADTVWADGDAAKAATQYQSMLTRLPKEAEPFRATLIMRLAQARLAARDTASCLAAIKLLDAMTYVPEHHALAARELQALIRTGKHPGHQRTAIPAIPKAQHTIHITPAGPSLADALTQARAAKAAGKRVEIVLAPGNYLVRETIKLGPADAGLVIRSKDPARPATLTGGVTLGTWKKITDAPTLKQLPEAARAMARECDLGAHGIKTMGQLVFGGFSSQRAKGGNHRFGTFRVPELFDRGKPQTLARWPNDKLTWLPINTPAKADADRFQRWAKEKDLWLYGYWHWDWADAYEKVAKIEANGTIHLEPPVNRYGFRRKQGCAVNALCELDQPGEWYLDTAANRVIYLPPKGFDPKQCVISAYNTVIEAKDCDHLQLRDVAVTFVRGDAMIFLDCDDLLLAGLRISDCSGLGLRIRGGKRHLVHSCHIESMGRGGIDLHAGNWQQLEPAHSVVENCRISNLSRIDRTYTPALLIDGMGFRIRHNALVDIPSSAIRLEACDALIELNHFRRCVYESGDQGSIDMWANPLYRGNIIRWNDFDSIVNEGSHYGAAAVRCDDFISGFMITQNVMRKGSGRGHFGAVQFNRGTDSYVEANVIIDWHKAFSGHTVTGEQWAKQLWRHPNVKRALNETPWQSPAWRKKYPMVRDLLNGDDNRNYLVGNLQLGGGQWGGVRHAVGLANTRGSVDVHGRPLSELKAHLLPWQTIPLALIGPCSD
jgi:hypothetical protein